MNFFGKVLARGSIMNQPTLSNLTHNELSRLDPEQEPGVYEEVFKRFIELNPQDEFRRGVIAQRDFNDRLEAARKEQS